MVSNPFHRAYFLTGPTAVGKSAVGVELARRLGAEVIAMDSMTLYRGMDIGTAKSSVSDRGEIPHHLIDRLEPWESASVADYRRWALDTLDDIESRGRRVLFVGGTALYLKSLLRGLFEGPPADTELRRALEDEAALLGDTALHARLAALDPASAARLHPHDTRRVTRALEVIQAMGQPLSTLQKQHAQPAPGVRVFALDRPRSELHARINQRVGSMFDAGFVDEVRSLIAEPQGLSTVAAQAVGYREVIDYLRGQSKLDETITLIQARTRQFAKRQMTWFRGLAEVIFWPVASDEPPQVTAERLAEAIAAQN
jgi:tRNA dimethylallyltransferase